jgi:hypothetical protein
MTKPKTPMNVVTLITPSEPQKKKAGRPASLEQPPLPQEILDGMSEIERAHYDFFIEAYSRAYKEKYGRMTPTALINVTQAGLDYVHLLRLQAEQMRTGKIVSQARQHPGIQVRAWLACAGLQEKDFETVQKDETRNETRNLLLKLSEG